MFELQLDLFHNSVCQGYTGPAVKTSDNNHALIRQSYIFALILNIAIKLRHAMTINYSFNSQKLAVD